ncbi:MAG: DUF2784 family protein, partial [bacterium]|nr:DUF2784 family protein [bacterium]
PFETAFLVVAIVLWSIYGNCPLTILEEHFRTLAGNPSGITSIGFIPYYANKLFAVGINSRVVNYSVYTTGVLFFLLSINWISPYLNFHLFHFRKSLRKLARAI